MIAWLLGSSILYCIMFDFVFFLKNIWDVLSRSPFWTLGTPQPQVVFGLNAVNHQDPASCYTRWCRAVQARRTKLYATDGTNMSSQEMDLDGYRNRQTENVQKMVSRVNIVTALLCYIASSSYNLAVYGVASVCIIKSI